MAEHDDARRLLGRAEEALRRIPCPVALLDLWREAKGWLDECERLRAALAQIQAVAEEDIRTDIPGSVYQIEADARKALEGKTNG